MLQELLTHTCFSQKEAQVYLACLALGEDTVFRIAKQANLKRGTVYTILDSLVRRGFVSIRQTPKATRYAPVHPRKLLAAVQAKEKILEEQMITLEAMFYAQTDTPKIRTFEGKENVERLYDEITDFARLKGKEVLAFGTVAYLRTKHPAQYTYWLRSIKSKRCHIREIVNADEVNRAYVAAVKQLRNKNHCIRYVPKDIPFFQNDNLLYGDTIALFSSQPDFFVIVIASARMAATFRSFFEIAWRQSATRV